MFDSDEFERRRWQAVVLAPDEREQELVEFLTKQRDVLAGVRLLSTEGIAAALAAGGGLRAKGVVPAGRERDEWLQSRLVAGEIEVLILLRDPGAASVDDPGLTAIHILADALNIPIATNLATASCLIAGLRSRPDVPATIR